MEVRNRFKRLDLIDRVPDELWTEVCDIAQETEIKTIPKKKKCKTAKRLSGEALQIAVKRKEAKSKGEKERYKHLNAILLGAMQFSFDWCIHSVYFLICLLLTCIFIFKLGFL